MEKTRIQLSPVPIIPGVTTVWHEAGEGIDITMDIKRLTFAQNSLDAIYAFHVLDHLFEKDAMAAMNNWFSLLSPGGQLFVVVDDFEFLARSMVGGDINIDQYNKEFSHPTQYTNDNLQRLFFGSGFKQGDVVVWHTDVPGLFPKKIYELIFSSKKV